MRTRGKSLWIIDIFMYALFHASGWVQPFTEAQSWTAVVKIEWEIRNGIRTWERSMLISMCLWTSYGGWFKALCKCCRISQSTPPEHISLHAQPALICPGQRMRAIWGSFCRRLSLHKSEIPPYTFLSPSITGQGKHWDELLHKGHYCLHNVCVMMPRIRILK